MADETAPARSPASKTTNYVEGVGTAGIGALVAPALMDRGMSPTEAALIAAVVGAVLPVVGSFARDWIAARRAKLGI